MSRSSCVRRFISTGVRSAPPPNHAFDVTTKRVFICTVGAFGFHGCAISEMPDAQKRGSSSAPGICLANSGANVPNTVDVCTPAFSKKRPRRIPMRPPPPGAPSWLSRVQGLRSKRPGVIGASSLNGPAHSSSSASKAAMILSCKVSNQALACALRVSITVSLISLPLTGATLPPLPWLPRPPH